MNCAQCQTELTGRQWKYCSTECKETAQRVERPPCQRCGRAVSTMRNRYCSRACADEAKRTRPPCPVCGGKVSRRAKHCSQRCRMVGARTERRVCASCGKVDMVTPRELRDAPRHCSWSCRSGRGPEPEPYGVIAWPRVVAR